MMKRKVALDVGDVRIGVAVSDMLGITANPRETYVRKKDDINADIAYFCEYAKKRTRTLSCWAFPKIWTVRKGTERRLQDNSAICSKKRADLKCCIRTKG